jgi:hypothetical protein
VTKPISTEAYLCALLAIGFVIWALFARHDGGDR